MMGTPQSGQLQRRLLKVWPAVLQGQCVTVSPQTQQLQQCVPTVWPAVLQGQRATVNAQSEQLQRRLVQLQGQVRPSPSARKRGRVASQASAGAVLKQVRPCLCSGLPSTPAHCQSGPNPDLVGRSPCRSSLISVHACLWRSPRWPSSLASVHACLWLSVC